PTRRRQVDLDRGLQHADLLDGPTPWGVACVPPRGREPTAGQRPVRRALPQAQVPRLQRQQHLRRVVGMVDEPRELHPLLTTAPVTNTRKADDPCPSPASTTTSSRPRTSPATRRRRSSSTSPTVRTSAHT